MFTEATEVQLTLFNDMHVQQVMSIVSQHPELTEVLKIQLHITKGQEPVGKTSADRSSCPGCHKAC